MQLLALVCMLGSLPLLGVEPIASSEPKLFREQSKTIKKDLNSQTIISKKPVVGLYREWVNPVKSVNTPSDTVRTQTVIAPSVRNPALEQTFFKSREWKPGKVVHLYEKSKDFDHLLNPLSLKDFNRFIYQRNSRSP